MQFKTVQPSRRALLSLAVMLTLAPMGAGVYHHVTSQDNRTAATIADLGGGYAGGIWSNKSLGTQNIPATLEVTSRTRTRFSGNLRLGGNDASDIPVTGNVSAAGRVALNGNLVEAPNSIRINVTGQLSAGGNALIGTYTGRGRGNEGPINDRGSIVMLLEDPQ